MKWPDLVNGLFESCGGLFIWLSIRKLEQDKVVAGISWVHMLFFTAWGWWNIVYYPLLGQWLSFLGGVIIVMTNSWYLNRLIHYSYFRKRKCPATPPISTTDPAPES